MRSRQLVDRLLSKPCCQRGSLGETYAVETVDPVPLEDGRYTVLQYGYVLEIDGVRCMRERCGGLRPALIKDSKVFLYQRRYVNE